MRPLSRALLVASLCVGCMGSAIDLGQLPEEPIAVLYWSDADAHDRAKLVSQRAPSQPGVAHVDDIQTWLRAGVSEDVASALARLPGYLSLVDARTGEIERVEAAPPGAVPLAWSHDHRLLLFATDRLDPSWQLQLYDRETGDVRPVTHGPLAHPRGDLGPDGRFVFTSYSRRGREQPAVHVAERVGGVSTRLLSGVFADQVRWSPDGGTILLAVADLGRRRGGSAPNVAIMAVSSKDGSEPRRLARGRDPDISVDGEWVVYSAPLLGGGWRLRRMRIDGTGKSPVGRGSRDELDPTLSPDARMVAYLAAEAGLQRLYIRRIDGTGDRVLVSSGEISHPVW